MDKRTVEVSKVYALQEMITYANGATVSKIVTRNKNGNTTLFSFDEGQNLSEHTAPFDAIVQIIDGSAKVTIAGKDCILKTGEIIIMPANVPHALEAMERFKMLLTMIRE